MEKLSLDRLTTLGHPQRMAVFRLLVRHYPGAMAAGDIAQALGLKPSTLSVYLGALRQAGLARQERRGTSLLYRADMTGMQQLVDYLTRDCCRGRPQLCLPGATGLSATGQSATDLLQGEQPMTTGKYNVLFICVGNSARSIFAEALLRQAAGDRFNAYSAGTSAYSELNPIAVDMLQAKGHDTALLRSKTVAEFQGEDAIRMDFVFTVCDLAANEDCPPWLGQPLSAHWGMADPVKATGTPAERKLAFQQAYGALKHRIEAFAALPIEQLDRLSLQNAVDRIGEEIKETETE